jgi:hypothetical protein
MAESQIRISAELLRDLLELPKDVRVIGDATGNVMLTVEGASIPEGYDEVLPSWRKLRDYKRHPDGVDVTEFIGFSSVGERREQESREPPATADQESTS